jgi:hypothetical protein
LAAPQLKAAYAWRLVKTTSSDLEQRSAFPLRPPLRPDWQPWKQLKASIQENDELWLFSSPEKFWRMGMGSDGVLLVRANEPSGILILAFN